MTNLVSHALAQHSAPVQQAGEAVVQENVGEDNLVMDINRRLIRIKSGDPTKGAFICDVHIKKYISSYSSNNRTCCNCFQLHGAGKAAAYEITLENRNRGMAVGLKGLVPGNKLCISCKKVLSSKLKIDCSDSDFIPLESPSTTSTEKASAEQKSSEKTSETTSESATAATAGGDIGDTEPEFQAPSGQHSLQDLNKWLVIHKKEPIDFRRIKQKMYRLEQVDKIFQVLCFLSSENTANNLISLSVEQSQFYEELLGQLVNYVTNSSSKADKVRALSVLPQSVSVPKIEAVFNVSRSLVMRTKELVKEKGILCTPNPKPGSKKLPDSTISALAGKNDVVTVRENGKRVKKRKHYLMANISHIHDEFLKAHPEKKISESKFAALRPKNCFFASKSGMHNVCVCTIHENPKLMFNGAELKTLAIITDIVYNQWESTDRGNIITRTSTVEEFTEDFLGQLEDLVTHHFIFKCQSQYFTELQKQLEDGEIIVVGDFAENYSFVVQDMVPAFFFKQKQATIHPFSVYFTHNLTGKLMQLSVAVISDCLDHSSTSFYAFQCELLKLIKGVNVITDIKKIFYFSDGCSGQYKNKKMAANVYYHQKDFNIQAEWHFFATSHGKSACDGIGGTVKRLAEYHSKQHTEAGSQITTPQRLFEWANKNIKGITTIWVSKEDVALVEKKLEIRFKTALAIDGIKSSHCIIPSNEKNIVTIKRYSKATACEKRRVSNAEELEIKLDDVRGFVVYYNKDEPEWHLGYVSGTCEENDEIYSQVLNHVKDKNKKYHYEFTEDSNVTCSLDSILTLVNPQIMRQGRLIKLLASDANTADILVSSKFNV
ncbi:hypothetical protein FOCC_FOCC012663 [Frankliniella occidentalis]|nr:hypothetical protein FOCC_FOCC012663 [Frankliniella occidentalis]